MVKTPDDRRRHPRVESRVEMESLEGEDGGGVTMTAVNVSMGGVYCSSSVDYPEMTRVGVRLRLPGGSRDLGEAVVDVEAVVVRRESAVTGDGGEEFLLALLFTDMDRRSSDLLARYIARLQ